MTPQNTPTEASKATPTPVSQPAQTPLAEPPKGVEFVEAPTEPMAPTQAGSVIQPVVVTAPTKAAKKHPKTDRKSPSLAIAVAVVIFAILAGLAYYAYTKSA